MLEKTAVIVNPSAAKGRTLVEFQNTLAEIKSVLGDPAIWMTSGTGHATVLTREIIKQGALRIIVVGGDGTINEVINGFFDENKKLLNPEVALGILPSGMGNDFVKNWGCPSGIQANIRRLLSGNSQLIDVGFLTCTDEKGRKLSRYFLNASSVGISGQIAKETKQAKKFFSGQLTYYWYTIKSLWSYRPKTIQIELDGKKIKYPACSLLVFANGQYFGGGMRIAPRAQIDDGRLDQITVSNMGFWFFLGHGLGVYKGQHIHLPQVTQARGKTAVVQCIEEAVVLVEADGDVVGQLPAKFEILPRQIRLLV